MRVTDEQRTPVPTEEKPASGREAILQLMKALPEAQTAARSILLSVAGSTSLQPPVMVPGSAARSDPASSPQKRNAPEMAVTDALFHKA